MTIALSTKKKHRIVPSARSKRARGVVTLAEVARQAGVSTCTVSRVLSGAPEGVPIRPQTRERVMRAAKELGYAPNAAARALAAGRTKTIGVVCYSIADPLVPPMLEAMENEATKQGYQLLISTTKNDAAQEAIQGNAYISQLQEKRVDAMLVFGGLIIEAEGYLDDYPQIPSATGVGITSNGLACSIDIDHHAGGVAVGKYLTSLGHRQVAFLTGGVANESVQRRQNGIREGLRKGGADLTCIGEGILKPSEAAGARDIAIMLKKHPEITAAVCRNDLLALGAMRALWKAGIRVPDQFSLVSWGDAYFSPVMCPSLTAIQTPFQKAGCALLMQLFAALENPHQEPVHAIMPMKLMIRESTGSARGGAL